MAKKRKNKRMRKRRWFTATERVEVWDRWQRGESSQSIGRVLDRGGSAIHRQLAVYGDIRPQSRCRSSRALTLVEREEIPRGIAAKESVRSIAVRLGRSPSTVSREVSRSGGSDSYRASEADERTWERARRPKTCRLPAAPTPHSKTAIPQLLDLKELMNLTSFEGMSLYLRLPTNPDPGTKRL